MPPSGGNHRHWVLHRHEHGPISVRMATGHRPWLGSVTVLFGDSYLQVLIASTIIPLQHITVLRQQQGTEEERRVRYVHGLAEAAPFDDGSFDLVTIQFVVHECTAAAIADVLGEARRLLRDGGTLAVVDINPRSPVIQNLPPLIFTLMKSTEPNMDEYVGVDLREALKAAGFVCVDTAEVDARHGAVLGRKQMMQGWVDSSGRF